MAHLYRQRGITQERIGDELRISQARVSRLLELAEDKGIIRTSIHAPPGIFTDLEGALEERYGISEVLVVDAGQRDTDDTVPALRAVAATFLEEAIPAARVVGISSWSETLLAAVDAMHPLPRGDSPVVVDLAEYGTDQAHVGGVVREDADDGSAPAALAVEPFPSSSQPGKCAPYRNSGICRSMLHTRVSHGGDRRRLRELTRSSLRSPRGRLSLREHEGSKVPAATIVPRDSWANLVATS